MDRLAVEKAKELNRRHPAMSFPVDMEQVAHAEGCALLNWPFTGPVKEVKRGRWIGLAQGLNDVERRHLIAHALAHHLLHSGNQLSFHDWQKATLHKQEREAEECAAHILMPEEELAKLDNVAIWEIAEYFGVPEELARQRVTEFATDTEIIRWQSPM